MTLDEAVDHIEQLVRDREEVYMANDNWENRSSKMRCATCMWWVEKAVPLRVFNPLEERSETKPALGRCRKHAPTLGGWPAVYADDWCGDHKIDENA